MKKNKKLDLRYFDSTINGGQYKGKKILIPDLPTTRSSKSILRESLFDTLQFEIINKNFVEVFAGSGSVGLEALSRGAKHVYFIERNKQVFALLNDNIDSISPTNTTTYLGDSFEIFPSLISNLESDGVLTYFYFDPPFSIRDGMDDVYERTIDMIEHVPLSICKEIIVEHMTKLNMPEHIGGLYLRKSKRFGKSTLSYYSPSN